MIEKFTIFPLKEVIIKNTRSSACMSRLERVKTLEKWIFAEFDGN
jgi:hypothetical protein